MVRKTKHRGQSASFMRSINPNLHNKGVKKTMAKRRMSRRSHRRYSHHSKGMKGGLMKYLMMAAGYGVVRAPVAGMTAPLVNKVYPSAYSGSLGNGLVGYGLYKYGSGTMKEVGKVALIVELANVGASVNLGAITGGSSSGSVF